MVKRIFEFLNKEIGGMHEAAYLLAAFAFMSQLLALVRDRLLAAGFGAGSELDIYYAAFRIPDFIFVSVASVVSVSVLVPFVIERIDKDKESAKRFVSAVFSFFSVFIVLVSALAFVLMPFLAKLAFPGITDLSARAELVSLARMLLLSPIFLGFSNFFASVTQAYRRFFAYAVSPLLYNLGIIAGIVVLAPSWGIKGVVAGVVAGSMLHCLTQIPGIMKEGFVPRFSLPFDWKSIKPVLALSFPRTLALSTNHISMLFMVAIASVIGTGAISVFTFSFNLQSVPLTIIGVSYSMAAFPLLSRLYSSGEFDKFRDQIVNAGRHIIFWSIPVTVLFVVLRAQVVRTVLGSGQFSWSDTKLTAASLALFTVSAVGQSMILLFVRAYYSASDTKKPLYVNAASAVLTVTLAFLLAKAFVHFDLFRYFIESLLRVEDVPATAELMLPLAYSIGTLVNMAVLWYLFERQFKDISARLFTTFWQSLGAALIMGAVAYRFLAVFDDVFDINTLPGIFLQGLFAGLIGIVVGIVVLKLLKSRELGDVWRTLHAKIWKAKPLVPTQEL